MTMGQHLDDAHTIAHHAIVEPQAIALAASLRWAADNIDGIRRDTIATLLRDTADQTIAESESTEVARQAILERIEETQAGIVRMRAEHAARLTDLGRRYTDATNLAALARHLLAAQRDPDVSHSVLDEQGAALLARYAPAGRAAEPDEDAASTRAARRAARPR